MNRALGRLWFILPTQHRGGSNLVYIIIFITIAAALGPLLSVLPSKHQRAVADFRERARRAGILVQLREPKNIPARLQRGSDEPLVCYSRRLKPAISGVEPEVTFVMVVMV